MWHVPQMQTKSFLKFWLLSVIFEKFTSVIEAGPITVERLEGCDWLRSSFIHVDF